MTCEEEGPSIVDTYVMMVRQYSEELNPDERDCLVSLESELHSGALAACVLPRNARDDDSMQSREESRQSVLEERLDELFYFVEHPASEGGDHNLLATAEVEKEQCVASIIPEVEGLIVQHMLHGHNSAEEFLQEHFLTKDEEQWRLQIEKTDWWGQRLEEIILEDFD